MSLQEEGGLILKLYDLRREAVMREARDYFFREFNPKTAADFQEAMFGPHGGHVRMVIGYWDMAGALVNKGVISLELFTETNGEYLAVFTKIEPLLGEIRATVNPRFAQNLEKLVDATPDGRQQVVRMREMFAKMAEMAARQKAGAARG